MAGRFKLSKLSECIHDIRNPLNTISVNAELGRLVLQQGLDTKKAIEAFNKIVEECQVCAEAINQLKVEMDNQQ